MKKLVLTQKQMISTSQRRMEHSFAGRNTQQLPVASALVWLYSDLYSINS